MVEELEGGGDAHGDVPRFWRRRPRERVVRIEQEPGAQPLPAAARAAQGVPEPGVVRAVTVVEQPLDRTLHDTGDRVVGRRTLHATHLLAGCH